MSNQQYSFKTNNGSGSNSSSNLANASSRDNLKNLMKKQQMNMNFIDNQFMQDSMNRTAGLGSGNNPSSPQGNNYNSSGSLAAQNYSQQKGQISNSQQQNSQVNKMIDAYQKNRPYIQSQIQQYQQQSPTNQSNNYGQSSPLRNNYNNLSSNQNMNSPTSRAATAQDSRRESNNYNNYTNNVEQLERKSSLGRNKLESSDAVNSNQGKMTNNNTQSKSSTNKVQQMLKDLMGSNQTAEKNSYAQYQMQNNYSKQNVNRTDYLGNQGSNSNYLQNHQNNNNSSRNEVSSLRSRENSNDRNKNNNNTNNTSSNNLTQNNMYSTSLNNNFNQTTSKHQSLSPFSGTMGRQNSGSLHQNNLNNSSNQNNSSFNQGLNYKNTTTLEISNFNSSCNNNESYQQKLLKASSSSKNLQSQLNDYESKNSKQSGVTTTKGKTPSSQVQTVLNNQTSLSNTLNKSSSNSKLRLQDDVIESVYKSNRSITPKYNTNQQNQNNYFNKAQTSQSTTQQQRNKTPLNNQNNQSNLKTLNDTLYQQIVDNSGSKSPLSSNNNNNNNTSFSNANNSSFNQMNAVSASTSNLKISQQNSLPIDLQNRRLTPTPLNQNLEMFERHQSLQNIIQMQEQQYGNQQYQQQNKSPLRTNNYMQPQFGVNSTNNSAKENISSISNNQNRSPNYSTNNSNNSNVNYSNNNNPQRESSKSPATSNQNQNNFGQTYNQYQTQSQQLQNNKMQQQQNLQHSQSVRGTSQEAKNNLQQQIIQLQQKNTQSKNKQANTSNISGGVSQSSTSSTSSNQKSVELNKPQNQTSNSKQPNPILQNLTQKQLQNLQAQQQQQQQQQQIQTKESSNQSPFFGNQSNPNNNSNLKKINTPNQNNQNDLLKAIQEQIKIKNERKQEQNSQPRKQKNKISQDFLDSTYFQFNTQLIEQMQHEKDIDAQKEFQHANVPDSAEQLKESLYLTSLKQEQQNTQNNLPSFGQLQSNYQMQAQQQQQQILQQSQQQQQQTQQNIKPKQPQPQINQSTSSTNQSSNKQTNNTSQPQKESSSQQSSQNISVQQYLQKQTQITQNIQNIEENNKTQQLNQQVKKSQQQIPKEKSTLALNNDQESVDSANTTACFSEELSKSTLAKINLQELIQIEQNLFDLQKYGFKNKKHTTKYCKNYLNSIAEQNVDNLERICSDLRQSAILNRMFILERICVMLSLHESLNTNNEEDSQYDNEDDDDDDCTNHIKNTLQYVHLNFFVFLDTVVTKYNFTENTKQVEQQIKKLFETRTKVKRFATCLNKQDKFQVISNYCDIIIPYLKNFVHNYDKEPFLAIAKILNNVSSQTVAGTMSILMDCFSKIISDLEEKATKDSKSSIEDSFSDLPTKQDVSTEKSKSNSVTSTTEKQKNYEESVQKQNQSNEQKQKQSQQENSGQQNSNKQEHTQKQIEKDYYAQLEDDDEEDEDEDEFDADRQIGTIPAPYLPSLDNQFKHTLVLDLDETLVHYQETPDDGGQFLIRPNAEIFLQKLSAYYEIVIFTAAVQDYADFILNVIDTTNAIKHRLYRQHTDRDGRSFVKDISKLGRDLSKTLIIDNLPENFSRQPTNGVLIQSWYGEADDRALFDLIPLLIDVQKSKKFTDVRIALQKLREQTMKNLLNGINDPHLNIVLDEID